MTRKRRRLIAVLAGLGMLGLASALVLTAFNDTLVFFYSPSDLLTKKVPQQRRLRLGGLVESASVTRDGDGRTVHFRITDGDKSVAVTYAGALPDLFREGQGVVVEGKLAGAGEVRADTVLAKHDENYMPREVVDALKKSGRWQEGPSTRPLARPAQDKLR
jgi:cytochrome c-type biogenesis protein CcmE